MKQYINLYISEILCALFVILHIIFILSLFTCPASCNHMMVSNLQSIFALYGSWPDQLQQKFYLYDNHPEVVHQQITYCFTSGSQTVLL
jgi:hypothetical protein